VIKRRTVPLLLAAVGVLALTAVLISAACSGTDVSGTVKGGANNGTPGANVPKSTGGTSGGEDKLVDGPASRYAPFREDLPGIFAVNVPKTFTQNISTFASSYLFRSNAEGQKYATDWNIRDGFNEDFDPDGLQAGVLKGNYFVSVEVYLFLNTAGATDAYTYINSLLAGRSGSEKQETKGLGLQSAGYKIVDGTVGASDTPQVYHRFLFRRGNVVAMVQTTGAESLMTIDRARDIAVIIDDRILGKRTSNEPTPIPTPKISVPPTPDGTATAKATP
jgi:hypothetical protein